MLSMHIWAYIHPILRYSEEELEIFHAIMKLERGFERVVDACATDTDMFWLSSNS